ncbi:MAG: hypothetical protein KDD21_01755 [Bacteroidetes bacterium]|nr:hypothetical protein [Bacteroidota bacterium]
MNNSTLKYIPIGILIGLIIVYVSRSMSNSIIFFPFWLNLLLYLIGLPIAWYYVNKWKIFSSDKEENKKMIFGINIVMTLIITFVILSFLRLPINFIIKQQSKNNPIITQTCPITYYSFKLNNNDKRNITYTFEGKNVRMKVRPTIMAKIKTLPESQRNITLNVRKSILGTYIIEDYTVKSE